MTTGEVLILLLTAIPLFILWVAALAEVVWRRRMPLARRIGWIAALFVVPVVALAVYVVVRPSRAESLVAIGRSSRGSSHGSLSGSSRSAAGTERAAALVLAAERHVRGELDDAGYDNALTALAAAAPGAPGAAPSDRR